MRSLRTAIHRRIRRQPDDEGFALLESLVSITLITTIMAAIGMFFVVVIQNVNHNRQAQVAAQLASAGVDKARAVGAAKAVSGRDANTVSAQLSATYLSGLSAAPPDGSAYTASAVYTRYLDDWRPAVDSTVAAGAGTNAPLPTAPVAQTVNGLSYDTSFFVGYCYRGGADITGKCRTESQSQAENEGAVEYVRVVVAVTWHGLKCPVYGCLSMATTLLNGLNDPLFNFNQSPPPSPSITTPATQYSDVGSPVYGIKSASCTPSVSAPCPASASGGVPSYVFIAQGLPPGLAIDGGGLVTGTPTTTGDWPVTVTVTDAFLSQATTSSFTWHVDAPLTAPAVPNQASVKGQSIGTPCFGAADGGSGAANLRWSDPSGTLPPGLSISGTTATLCVTGTPSTTGTSNVTLTVTDSKSGATKSVGFVWSVGTLVIVPIDPQVGTLGTQLSLSLAARGGSGSYLWSIDGVTPSGAGFAPTVSGSTLTGSPTATGSYAVVLRLTDAANSSLTTTATLVVNVYGAPTITGPGDGSAGVLTQVTTKNQTPQLPFSYACPSQACSLSVTAVNTATGATDSLSWLKWSPASISDASGSATLGNLPATTVGKWTVTASITQGTGSSADTEHPALPFTLDVRDAPKFVTAPADKLADPSSTSTQPVAAYCYNNPSGTPDGTCQSYSLQVAGGAAPSWFTYDASNGLIRATPPTGTFAKLSNVTLTAVDAAGVPIVSDPFTWTFDTAPALQVANQTSLAHGTTRLSPGSDCAVYCYICPNPSGCTLTYTSDQSWLTVGSDGTITVASAKYTDRLANVTITAQDGLNVKTSTSFTWTLTAPPPPTITAPAVAINAGKSSYFAYPLQYACPAPTGCTFAVASGTLPTGLTLDSATGVIYGVPTGPSTTNLKVKISDTYTTVQSATSAAISITVTRSLPSTQPVLLFNRTDLDCLNYASAVVAGTTCYPSGTGLAAYQFRFSASGAAGTLTSVGAPTSAQCLKSPNTDGGAVTLVNCGSGSPTTWTLNTSNSTGFNGCTRSSCAYTISAGSITTTSGSNVYELVLGTSGTLTVKQVNTTARTTTATTQSWGVFW